MTTIPSLTESLRCLGPIPKTMRAGVYRDQAVVRVEEVSVPEVGPNEVLIQVAACGVCGTDIKKIFLSILVGRYAPMDESAMGLCCFRLLCTLEGCRQ